MACMSVLVIGLMLYVAMALTIDSLTQRQVQYYQETGFAHGFASLVAGPRWLADEIQNLPGVDKAVGRLVQDVMLDKELGTDNTTLRLVSYQPQQPVNGFQLLAGRLPSEEKQELLVSPAFLQANQLRFGDAIPLIIHGKPSKFIVTGTINSPEYIYEIPSGQSITPDPKAFGVAFVPYSSLSKVLGQQGQINDIAFTLDKGTKFSHLKLPVTRLLNNYGLVRLYERSDQVSHSMLEQELVGLKASATSTPVIFLLVAASILYIMLKRMVEQQRGQVGLLKAFGYTDWEIMRHYLGYPLLIGGLGGFIGGLVGSGMSYSFAKLYQQYFNIPGLTGQFSLWHLTMATLLSLVFALLAGYQGCKGVLKLSPAEAMRPPTPAKTTKTLIERITILWQVLSTQSKMAVRNIFRNKQRSALTVFGIACAFSMMGLGNASFDSTFFLLDFQYGQVEKYGLKVSLRNLTDATEVVSAGQKVEGVTRAEPILELPVTLSNRWLQRDIAIQGLPAEAQLYRLLDQQGHPVNLPPSGLVISEQLAKLMQIKLGDRVTIKPLLGDVEAKSVVVRKIVPQYVGLGAYMEINALSSMMQQPPVASALLLQVQPDQLSQVIKALQKGENVGGIYDKEKMRAQFAELMESSQATQYVLLFFSFITGFAIVYNVNIIALSERERELATLMVLGMTEGEVNHIMVVEQALIGLVGCLVGIPLTYGMLKAVVSASGSEIYNMPLVVEPSSFMMALGGTLLFLVVAQWKVRGRIAGLSMLDVLKQQE